MKRKVKIMNRESEQLKDDITIKEVALEKEHQEFQRLERERECLKVTRFILNYHVLSSFFCLSTGLMLIGPSQCPQ